MPTPSKVHRQTMPQEEPALVAVLLSLSRSCRQLMQIKLVEIDVMVGQDQFLDVLTAERGIPVSLLAQRLNVRPSTTSKMADRLVAQGWVLREVDDEDGRRTRLRLTPVGLEVQTEVRRIWEQTDAELASALAGASEQASVTTILAQMSAALDGRLQRLR
ncbi:MarR family winged helix-turn-helix transcriptional regulator [Antarcticirhabdus aurantiaca]|uniref:MarR family transcriptional regulator n=1 Tax=Antarcticirhabdus aurantiaca TaxID=2606717 RepID=A0ACD4NN01_9HYPH|nr:MarR family transcriptional regulator [Antarcticirhabdus aurantiaca]WAJ28244.1 MarR family transcriptional regulator [Jeongeuplla avenae]